MKYVIYSAINKPRLVYDTLYSIMTMSYFSSLNDVKIVIYTNQLNRFIQEFENHKFGFISNIILEDIEDTEVEKWINNGYIYNIKIQVLGLFMNKYKANGLFLDSDMFVKNKIDTLLNIVDSGNFVMYKCFGNFASFSYGLEFLEIINILSMKFKQYVDINKLYYQSGVIGINYKYKDIIVDVQRLCNGMYKYTKLIVSEEVAFSLIMQDEILKNKNKIYVANRFVSTYNDDTYRLFTALAFNTFLHEDEKHLINLLKCYNLEIKDIILCYESVISDLYDFLRIHYGINRSRNHQHV